MNGKQQAIYKDQLVEFMRELAKDGYKSYLHNDSTDGYLYGYLITPSDTVMYVQRGDYGYGWTFSIQYKPSKNNGSGCGCLANHIDDLSLAVIQQAEREGLAFANRLNATHYKNSAEWLKGYWDKDHLQEIA